MSEIDVSKCEYYNAYHKTCGNYGGEDEPYCNAKELKCSYYIRNLEKQLQQLKAENEGLKSKLDMQESIGYPLCFTCIVDDCECNKSKLYEQCIYEIEEICKVNAINTCWTVLNLCDKCDEKEECGLQSPLAKLDAISNIIKQAKESE